MQDCHDAIKELLNFSLVSALQGRRSRRFFMGGKIPEGPLAFTSRQAPMPLSETEKMLVLSAVAGNTGWNYLIPYNDRYAPKLPNYAGSAGGRSFPSSAGFHTSEIFFTDDDGTYFMETRDASGLMPRPCESVEDMQAMLEAHRRRIRKIGDRRLHLPPEDPHIESHNHWVANRPGTLFIMPVADVAQHNIANICYYLQNRYCLYDDIHGQPIPGMERFKHLFGQNEPVPLSYMERYSLLEANTEISMACFAGTLMLQAMGLGGWMFNGANPLSILGASGDPSVPGLGFRYDTREDWVVPNPTGLPGVFEAYCPPHYPDMHAAVEALVRRKYGPGGPFNPNTPGPWKDSRRVRGGADVHTREFVECVTLTAHYIFEKFGKFPGTVPSVLLFVYLQAQHIDLEFYDLYIGSEGYLKTHKEHAEKWHSD